MITQGRQWRTELGGGGGGETMFLAMEDGEDSAAGPLKHTYLAESSAETSAECSRRLETLRDKEVSPPYKPREQEENKNEFKRRKHVLESSQARC